VLRNNKGFTLMEILVVVTIIGILAAIAVPSYIYAVEQGREDACAANVQILTTQVERYRLQYGEELTVNEEVGETLVGRLTQIGFLVGNAPECPIPGGFYRLRNGKVECDH